MRLPRVARHVKNDPGTIGRITHEPPMWNPREPEVRLWEAARRVGVLPRVSEQDSWREQPFTPEKG